MLERHNISISNNWVSGGDEYGGVSTNEYPPKLKQQYYAIHFNSIHEYTDYCANTPPIGENDDSTNRGSGFSDTESYEQAIDYAINGSEEHRDKYLKSVSDLNIVLGDTDGDLYKKAYAVAGAYPDIARYVAGEPCHMVLPRGQRDKPIIKIGVPINGRASISSKTMFNYGAALLRIVDQIESSGTASVELTGVCCLNSEEKVSYMISIPLKRAGDALSIDTLAFHFCSSSSLRRLMFRMIETIPCKHTADEVYAYGKPQQCTRDHITKFDNLGKTFDLMMPIMQKNMELSECWNILKDAVSNTKTITIDLG
jgi:hypothetical protein